MTAAVRALRTFGANGTKVAPVGQGTWRLEMTDTRAGVESLRRGLDLGLTHIDTAEMYGSGAAETIVGAAIEGRRDEVFLVSKVLPSNASRRGTVAACERSLERLKTDRLDCYLLHWRGDIELGETIAGFQALVRDGKIRSWGVSNFDVDDLAELAALSSGMPACNQVLYHLKDRSIEHRVIPWCEEHGVAVVAYTPFGQTPNIFKDGSAAGNELHAVAAAHAATARQVALAFLLHSGNTFVIPKAASAAHVADNARAAALRLTAEDLSRIDAAFPRGKPKRGLSMI